MLDLNIDCLRLDMPAFPAHRVRPIVSRAVSLLGERLSQRSLADLVVEHNYDITLSPGLLTIDATRATDEQAAQTIADGIYNALILGLEV
jgi:hypothetical protein